jgi:hypothetical protein
LPQTAAKFEMRACLDALEYRRGCAQACVETCGASTLPQLRHERAAAQPCWRAKVCIEPK